MEGVAEANGIDIAILGLGPNGHVGFNEPGSTFDSPTRMVKLTAESIRSNAVYWGEEGRVPPFAFSLGLGTLARARRTLLLVSGEQKAGYWRRRSAVRSRRPCPPPIFAPCPMSW